MRFTENTETQRKPSDRETQRRPKEKSETAVEAHQPRSTIVHIAFNKMTTWCAYGPLYVNGWY